MCHPMHAVRKRLLLATLAIVLFAAQGLQAAAADTSDSAEEQRAPLTLILNGVEKGIVMVVLRADDALVAERDLVDASVPLPGAHYVTFSGTRWVSVASLAPKVAYSIDLANLELRLQ